MNETPLKTNGTVPRQEGESEKTEENQRKLLSLLGLARRAGRIALGKDAAEEELRKGHARLILLAKDLSPRTASGVVSAAEETGTPVVKLSIAMDEISMALDKRTGVVAVNDAGFAKKLHALSAVK